VYSAIKNYSMAAVNAFNGLTQFDELLFLESNPSNKAPPIKKTPVK
jgi:hypothetical protein